MNFTIKTINLIAIKQREIHSIYQGKAIARSIVKLNYSYAIKALKKNTFYKIVTWQ